MTGIEGKGVLVCALPTPRLSWLLHPGLVCLGGWVVVKGWGSAGVRVCVLACVLACKYLA